MECQDSGARKAWICVPVLILDIPLFFLETKSTLPGWRAPEAGDQLSRAGVVQHRLGGSAVGPATPIIPHVFRISAFWPRILMFGAPGSVEYSGFLGLSGGNW